MPHKWNGNVSYMIGAATNCALGGGSKIKGICWELDLTVRISDFGPFQLAKNKAVSQYEKKVEGR